MWKSCGLEVIYESDGREGLFSFSQAINRARRRATGDCFLSYSVDALPPSNDTLARLMVMLGSTPWVAGWPGQIRYSEMQSQAIINGAAPEKVGDPVGGISLGREALVAVRANVWDELKGYDERFIGWGPEDRAWHLALKTFHPNGWDAPFEKYFRTLSHPTVPRTALKANIQLFKEYRRFVTNNRQDFRRYYLSRSPE